MTEAQVGFLIWICAALPQASHSAAEPAREPPGAHSEAVSEEAEGLR